MNRTAPTKKKAGSGRRNGTLDALREHHRRRLDPLWPKAPFVLRFAEWKRYPAPVLVVSERSYRGDRTRRTRVTGASPADEPTFETRGALVERGRLYGEPLNRVRPVLKGILRKVADDAGVPLELDRFAPATAAGFRGNLPLDDEAGAKLALVFKLTDRIHSLDRVELLARRVDRFTREEAAYWLSRMLNLGPRPGAWAVAGMKIMLAGEPGDPAVHEILRQFQSG